MLPAHVRATPCLAFPRGKRRAAPPYFICGRMMLYSIKCEIGNNWSKKKADELEGSYDFKAQRIHESEIEKHRYHLLGLYKENDTIVRFSEFETDSFDPGKLAFIEPLRVDAFLQGWIGEIHDSSLNIDSLAYDDRVIGVEEHDFSYRRIDALELVDGEHSIRYLKDLS